MKELELERITRTITRLRLKIENSPDNKKVSRWKERVQELEQGYEDWKLGSKESTNVVGIEIKVPVIGGSI